MIRESQGSGIHPWQSVCRKKSWPIADSGLTYRELILGIPKVSVWQALHIPFGAEADCRKVNRLCKTPL